MSACGNGLSGYQKGGGVILTENNRLRSTSSSVVCLLMLFVFSSCTATSGTRVPLNPTQLQKIKKVGTLVKKEEDFSVRLSRAKMSGVGAVFGLIGAGIEAGLRSSNDAKLEEGLKPILGDYDITKVTAENLNKRINSQKVFGSSDIASVEDSEALRKMGIDGVLEVTFKEWGLRLCSSSSVLEQVQVGLGVHGRIFLLGDGSTIWERDDLYLDGECRRVEEFRLSEGMLKNALSRAADNLAGRVVNEILFP